MLGAVEGHVLQEVRHAALGVLLGQAPDVDVQAQVAAVPGLGVPGPRPAQPVLEVAELEARVDREVGALVLPRPATVATRLEYTPALDGDVLDDPSWTGVPALDSFWQTAPFISLASSVKTKWWPRSITACMARVELPLLSTRLCMDW